MSFSFNANEVFEIAEQIERNGANFYRLAAKNTDNDGVRHMLLDFVAMENDHEQAFVDMRKKLLNKEREKTSFVPNDEAVLYLKAIAENQIFGIYENQNDRLTGKETLQEIIKKGIASEKESILFYLGMMEMVPEEFGKSKIKSIIMEEMSHITFLTRKLRSSAVMSA